KSEFYSDAVRLRIILNNIISNAIKYHRVDQPTPTITIDINIESELSYIIVQDNGMGIGEKDLAKVFDMFYRASNESEGSGLGLYLVKSTVEKLNGSINVESTIGKGTTFKIVLPNMKVREVSAAKAIGSIAG
ncbi:MAG TPA: HAMP domain-containing sensor histidine kinase, partial [Cytophagaceae bacterium]